MGVEPSALAVRAGTRGWRSPMKFSVQLDVNGNHVFADDPDAAGSTSAPASADAGGRTEE